MLNRGLFARYGTVLLAALGLAGAAQAGIDGSVTIIAQNWDESGNLVATSDPVEWQVDADELERTGHTSWSTSDTVAFMAGSSTVATLNPELSPELIAAGVTPGSSGFTFFADPVVNLNFAVQANPAFTTTFTIYSALLSFPTITNGTGDASAAFTVTNNSFAGSATLTGATGALGPGMSGGFAGQYNGFIGTGTTFADLHTLPLSAAGAFASNSRSESIAPTLIPGGVSDMSSVVRFTLTAGDLASGTTTFQIVPEPASLALLAMGGLLAIRRR